MMTVLQLIPTFHVRDVRRAAEWYRDHLGWEIDFIAEPDYTGVSTNGLILHLAQWQKGGEMPPCQMYVLLKDGVDEYAARLAEKGVTPYHGPQDQPYGRRECNIRDVDGNYIHIGQPI